MPPAIPELLALVLMLPAPCCDPATSIVARIFACLCAAKILGSSCWARSHHTVAFCFRISATYDVGLVVEVLREEVERRTLLA